MVPTGRRNADRCAQHEPPTPAAAGRTKLPTEWRTQRKSTPASVRVEIRFPARPNASPQPAGRASSEVQGGDLVPFIYNKKLGTRASSRAIPSTSAYHQLVANKSQISQRPSHKSLTSRESIDVVTTRPSPMTFDLMSFYSDRSA